MLCLMLLVQTCSGESKCPVTMIKRWFDSRTSCVEQYTMCSAAFDQPGDYWTCQVQECKSAGALQQCTWDYCQTPIGKTAKFCSASYQRGNPTRKQFLDPSLIAKCKLNAADCTDLICGNDEYKDLPTCKNALEQKANCKSFDRIEKGCTLDFCQTYTIGKALHDCQKIVHSAQITKCKTQGADCTDAICGNSLYKDQTTCKDEFLLQKKCDANVEVCTYDYCQTGMGKTSKYCLPAWQTENPSQKQFLDPAQITKCKTNRYDCTDAICGNSLYKDQTTCKDEFLQQKKCDESWNDKCTYEYCQTGMGKTSKYCMPAYQKQEPSQKQFLNPAQQTKCKMSAEFCDNPICYQFVIHKGYAMEVWHYQLSCKLYIQAEKCKANIQDCTYAFCKTYSQTVSKKVNYCSPQWQKENPSQQQFLDPAQITQCKTQGADCTDAICGNSLYKDQTTCKDEFKENIKCSANEADCTYKFCQTPIGAMNHACNCKGPSEQSKKQCWDPSNIAKQCQFSDKSSCNKSLCKGHTEGPDRWENCPEGAPVGIIIAVVVGVVLLVAIIIFVVKRRSPKGTQNEEPLMSGEMTSINQEDAQMERMD